MARRMSGIGLEGLLPLTANRGNREPKVDPEKRKQHDTYIEQNYETVKAQGKKATWCQLVVAWAKES